MHEILKKKIHPIISYPVLILFSFSLVVFPLFFYIHSTSFAQTLLPFEGRITKIDYYSCSCSLSILLTIMPTVKSRQGQQPAQLLFFYGAQAGVPFMPKVFANYMVYSPGSQRLLGNYVPTVFPCWAYSGTSCTLSGNYPAIFHVGTSWY